MDETLSGADYKTRLEQKICTFKDTPEPICDLSECNLEKLPGNSLFSLIKVYRKEILVLKANRLKSLASGGQLKELELLQVLDLSHNKFKVIPVDIAVLTNLRVSHHHMIIKNSRIPLTWKFTLTLILFIGIVFVEQLVIAIAIYYQPASKAGVAGYLQQ